MKRLALLLAAAVLGTGCIVMNDTCESTEVDVSWGAGFDGPDAVAGRGCAAAGVSYVDVYVDDQPVPGPLAGGHFPCGDLGVTVTGVPRGARRLTVEGVGPDGSTILYRDDRTFTAGGCGVFSVGTAPAAGYVSLEYLFSNDTTPLPPDQQVCAGSFLWLSIYDRTARQPAVLTDRSSNPTAYSCGGPFALALPSGPYVFQWMEERGPATAYALESSDCADREFTIDPARTTAVPVNLDVTAPAACAR